MLFFHLAGSGKETYRFHELWSDEIGDRRTFSRRQFRSADVRIHLLRQAHEQMQGRFVRIFDPTDFSYVPGLAFPMFAGDSEIVAFFPPRDGAPDTRGNAVYGPYFDLEAGRWRASFVARDGAPFVYPGAKIDVTVDMGKRAIVPPCEWPKEGCIRFDLAERAEKVEFRIFRGRESAEFSHLRVEKDGIGVSMVGAQGLEPWTR